MMSWIVATVMRAFGLTLVWGALSGWRSQYAVYGAVAIAVATGFSLLLLPPRRQVQLGAWPKRAWLTLVLINWFLARSAQGGVDVALRALKRPADIAPIVVPAPMLLPDGHARQVALLMMNLMPGSMVQRVVTGPAVDPAVTSESPEKAMMVELHSLAEALQPAEQWAILQRRVGAAAGTRT